MGNTYEITNAGKALIAKAQTGAVIDFTRAKIGKGDLGENSPADFTDLISPEATEVTIQSKLYVPGTSAKITLTYNNQSLAVGFSVNEVGLFADDPDVGEILFLYCYSDQADYLPEESYALVDQVLNLIVDVGNNPAGVTAQISSDTNLIRDNFLDNSILKADVAGNPEALTINEDTVFGRGLGGNPKALTPNEVREILNKATIKATSEFESGVVMLFGNAAAPIGWTKKIDWADNAMLTLNCEVNGSALASGGSANPQSCHYHTTNGHALNVSELAGHAHSTHMRVGSQGQYNPVVSYSLMSELQSGSTGGEGSNVSHSHGDTDDNSQPRYQEIIACIKD